MRARLSILAWILACMTACGSSSVAQHVSQSPAQTATLTGQLQSEKLDVGGVTRLYWLFVPSTIDPVQPAPLLVVLHPCPATTGAQTALGSHLDDTATANRFVAVYPQGAVMAATGGNCWNAGTCCTGADDVGFISQLIDHLTAELHIDQSRVFVTGFSYGASMAYRLGCELSGKVTAIAPVSGALVVGACKPARPVSVLIMHGTADMNFPYQGDVSSAIPSVASDAALWARIDGCANAGPQTTEGIVTTTQWRSCNGGTAVTLELITGAPHTWFGYEPNPVPGEPKANTVVWDFFKSLPIRT